MLLVSSVSSVISSIRRHDARPGLFTPTVHSTQLVVTSWRLNMSCITMSKAWQMTSAGTPKRAKCCFTLLMTAAEDVVPRWSTLSYPEKEPTIARYDFPSQVCGNNLPGPTRNSMQLQRFLLLMWQAAVTSSTV